MKTLLLSLITVLALNSSAQNVNIPDPNFKAYLVGNTLINTNSDTEIQLSEAVAFTGWIVCGGFTISDLTGIEAFISLEVLLCGGNQLTSLDVSNNTALTELQFGNNQLTSIDVTQNSALTILNCENNELTSLDVSNNTALFTMMCNGNNIASLDVSNNTALASFACYGNQLTALDVSNNTVLFQFSCFNNQLSCLNVKNGNNSNFVFFGAESNPNLTCIEVDDVAYSNTNWSNIDPQSSFNTSCANPCALGIEEVSNTPKQLLKIVDLMGRETPYKPNTVLIYVYDDGSTEKVFKVEL